MKSKNIFRNLLSLSTIVFFIWLISKNAGEYLLIVDTIKSANFVYIGWALVLSIGNNAIMSSIFKANFSIFAPEITIGYMLPEVFTFSFLTISNPLGVTGGMAYMVRNLVKKGYSYIKSIFSFFSTQLSINLGLLPFLLITLWLLKEGQHLKDYQVIAFQALVVLNVVIIICILFILVLPNFSIKLSSFFGKYLNRGYKSIFKKSLFNAEKLSMYILDISESSKRFDKSVFRFFKILIISFLYHGINIASLYTIFLAFNLNLSPIYSVILYGIIALFSIVSPTPQGIGIVEGLAQLSAISIGIPAEPAIVSILTYRLFTIWLPAIFGLFVLRSSKKQGEALPN